MSKHHDGFALWDAPNSYYWKRGKKYGPWNSVAIGPRRDIIGELAIAVALKWMNERNARKEIENIKKLRANFK